MSTNVLLCRVDDDGKPACSSAVRVGGVVVVHVYQGHADLAPNVWPLSASEITVSLDWGPSFRRNRRRVFVIGCRAEGTESAGSD